MDMCLSSDSNLPKLITKQVGNIVHYVQCDIPANIRAAVGNMQTVSLSKSKSQDALGFRWESRSLGISDGSVEDCRIFTTPWARQQQIKRISLVKVAAQFIPIKIGVRNFRTPLLKDVMNRQGTFSNAGAVFFRFAKFNSASISSMLWNNITLNLPQYRFPDFLAGRAPLEKFIGEGNAGVKGKSLSAQFANWRIRAFLQNKGGIIAGGDGSAKLLPAGQEAAFAWVVMAIGPLSLSHISKQPASYVKVLASGGSADWTIRKFRTNTRAEKLHILAAMIALLPAGLNTWYFVDYSGAISKAIDVCTWIASDWIICEDRDILSAILYMQEQWDKAGLIFKLLKIKAHPENWCSLHPHNYKALHQMAVIQDTAAKAVFSRYHGTGVRPFLPGQFRFQLAHQGETVVGPIRKYLKDNISECYSKQHICSRKHNGNFHLVNDLTEWSSLECWAGKCWTGFTPMSNCKYFFQRWATLSFQVKTGILQQDEEDQNNIDCCTCGEPETMWHLLSECLSHGFPSIRRKHSERRVDMIKELGFSEDAAAAIVANAEIKKDGTYPDWNDEQFDFELIESPVTKWLQKGRGFWSHWFQRGLLPSGFLENSRGLLGITSKQAKKFGVQWLDSKRCEAHDLWERRNNIKHDSSDATALLGELRQTLKKLVLSRRHEGLHTLTNAQYIKLGRNRLKILITSYEADEAIVNASQPTILAALQQQGLDPQEAEKFTNTTISTLAIAAARSQALQRRKKAAKTSNTFAKIDTIFDRDNTDSDSESEIDLDDSSADAIAIVTSYMKNATFDSTIDREAMLDISATVESMLLHDKEDWEI